MKNIYPTFKLNVFFSNKLEGTLDANFFKVTDMERPNFLVASFTTSERDLFSDSSVLFRLDTVSNFTYVFF